MKFIAFPIPFLLAIRATSFLALEWRREKCESNATFPLFFQLLAASLSGIEFIDHNLNVIPTPDEDLRRAANIGKQSRS